MSCVSDGINHFFLSFTELHTHIFSVCCLIVGQRFCICKYNDFIIVFSCLDGSVDICLFLARSDPVEAHLQIFLYIFIQRLHHEFITLTCF